MLRPWHSLKSKLIAPLRLAGNASLVIEPIDQTNDPRKTWLYDRDLHQGTLESGARHVYSRRIFYVDEDSWQIAVAESYDAKGRLWRVNEAHAVERFDVPVLWSTLEVFHDLQQERYLVNGLDNERGRWRFSEGSDPREFSPNALTYDLR